jgi:hypothetical protein
MALGLGLSVSTADAAPVSGLSGPKSDPAASSAVEKTYWVVRCRYSKHYHKRVCRRVWVEPKRYYHVRPHYGFRYHYHRPHRYYRYRSW